MDTTVPTIEEIAAVETTAGLAECMRRLHQSEGKIPLRELESWGLGHSHPMRKSTLGDALQGRRTPSPQLLLGFLAAMKVREESAVRAWLEARDRASASQPGGRERSYADSELGPVPAHQFFVETDKVDEIARSIKNAQEQVWLLGTTLAMHVPFLEPVLRRAVANNLDVRVLLITPGGAAMDMSVLRAGPEGLGHEEQEEHLSNNLTILRRLAQLGPRLEVRLIDYIAPYTLYAYDPGLETGRMQMRLGSFHGDYYLRPTFQVDRARDEAWFEYFYGQFVSMWNAAEPYDVLDEENGS